MKTLLLICVCLNLYSQEKGTDDKIAEDYHQYLAKYFLKNNPVLDTKLHYVTLANEFEVSFVWDGIQVDSITFTGEICNYFIEPIVQAVQQTADFWKNAKIKQTIICVPFLVSINSPSVMPSKNTCEGVVFPQATLIEIHQTLLIPKMTLSSTY